MKLTLRRGLHHREVSGAHIFFDLAADRYFLLSGTVAPCFERFLTGSATETDCAALDASGLLGTGGARASIGKNEFLPAVTSLVDNGLPSGSITGAAMSLWRLRRVRASLRHRSLADVLEQVARTMPARAARVEATSIRIAANFHRAGRLLSMQDQCLVRGIAMMTALTSHGVAASLVFGVTMPFAAHCWVQVGDCVLTDPLDIVRNYQPIYIL